MPAAIWPGYNITELIPVLRKMFLLKIILPEMSIISKFPFPSIAETTETFNSPLVGLLELSAIEFTFNCSERIAIIPE